MMQTSLDVVSPENSTIPRENRLFFLLFPFPQADQNDMSLIYFGAMVNPLIGNLVKLIMLYLHGGSCSHLIQIHDVSKLAYLQNKRLVFYPNVVNTSSGALVLDAKSQ